MNTLNRLTDRLRSLQKTSLASVDEPRFTEASGARREAIETLIIGVGNEFRGDDAIGICVARRLARLRLPNIRIIEESGEGADLVEAFASANCVYLIDAVSSQGLPGATYRFEVQEKSLPAQYLGISSHAFGVSEAIEIARSLGQLPQKLVVYGIEGSNFETGTKINPLVEQAADNVIRQLLQELGVL